MNAHTLFRIPIILAIALSMAAPAGFTALAEAPPNDDITNATVIDSLPFSATFDLTEATSSPNDPWTTCDWYGPQRTVWFQFTPAKDMTLKASIPDKPWEVTFSIFTDTVGSNQEIYCSGHDNTVSRFNAQFGHTYYFLINYDSDWEWGSFNGNFTLSEILPPAHNDFANATQVDMGFEEWFDITLATLEDGEPAPTCASDPVIGSAWYSYPATVSGPISFNTQYGESNPVLAAYAGSSFSELQQISCGSGDAMMTLQAEAGRTYYFQLSVLAGRSGDANFHLYQTPPPEIGWVIIEPGDPSIFNPVTFCADTWDPANVGIASKIWNFGDGVQVTPEDYCLSHQYTADGDYAVSFVATTFDGRSVSYTQTLPVRTHDVGITKVTAPLSASVNQTRTITVDVKNTRYPETVHIVLYKSVVGGFQEVGYLNQYVPVRSGNRTTRFTFNYTFSPEDATLGKVTFKAVAELQGARDAFPADNEAVSTPPTKVARR